MRRLVLFLAALLVGCDDYVYHVEMRPQGQQIGRRLSISGGIDDNEMARIGDLYGQQADANVFVGTFESDLPTDIGRGGFYLCSTTQLGSTMLYGEQFLGEQNPAGTVTEMQSAADQLTDILIGWFEAELGDETGFAELRSFCNTQLRQDIMSLALTIRMWKIADRYSVKDLDEEYPLRLLMYLFEHDYLDAADVPPILAEEGGIAVKLFRRGVARRMGWEKGQAMPDSLAFLQDNKSAEESLESYLRQTDRYRQACHKAKQEDPNAKEPEPADCVEPVLAALLSPGGIDFFGRDDKLFVRLATGVEPMETNGQWDEPNGMVHWSEKGNHGGEVTPVICYARWVAPNTEFQQKHFGKIGVDFEQLSRYCSWHAGLSKNDAQQWDGFLGSLAPGDELAAKLQAFRFTDEKEGVSRAKPAVELLTAAIF